MKKYAGHKEQSLVSRKPDSSGAASAQEPGSQLAAASETTPKPEARSQMYPAGWDVMILLLAITGGSVDAVIMTAFGALPGAQTGNTVLLGISLAHGQFPLAATQTAAFFGYLVGTAIGQFLLVKHRHSWPWPSAAGTIEIVELIFLGVLILAWHHAGVHPARLTMGVLIAFSAIAMGIQSAVVLDLPNEKPTTTYITGMVTTFVTRLIEFLHLIEASPQSSKQRGEMAVMSLTGPWIYGLTWLVYLAGAIAGILLFFSVREIALVLPIVLLISVVLLGRNLHRES